MGKVFHVGCNSIPFSTGKDLNQLSLPKRVSQQGIDALGTHEREEKKEALFTSLLKKLPKIEWEQLNHLDISVGQGSWERAKLLVHPWGVQPGASQPGVSLLQSSFTL